MRAVSWCRWEGFEAARRKVSLSTIRLMFKRGEFPGLKRRKVNARVVKVLLPDDVAALIESPESAVVLQRHKKPMLPKVYFCECGKPAVVRKGGYRMCGFCAEMEGRLEDDFHSGRGREYQPMAKYFEVFTATNYGRRARVG